LLLGSVIVVASGLYILWRETLRSAARRQAQSKTASRSSPA
jgi:hypothetical protein